MNLTLLTQLSAWPLIVPPDWAECELWFARPVRPQLSDCLVAFNRLPINEDAIKYRPITRDRTQPKGLLVMETHNTCQLKFHASGKWIEENAFSIDISPNKIRNMLGRLMDKCVQGEDMGGFVTNGLGKTINWILREDTEFPGEPGKTPAGPRNLFIPKSATFLTAMIWSTPTSNIEQFEPGANHPVPGELLYDALQKKAIQLRRADPHSGFANELFHRDDFLLGLFTDKQWDLLPPWWTWWGTERQRPWGANTVSTIGSFSLLNTTGLQTQNFTAL